MGLDMFLNKVENNTRTEFAYWRKANQIHNWFVENIQEGKDDCGTYQVSGRKLKELVNLCKEVLQNFKQAEELLPTREGFFFGSTAYDEDYYEDLHNTIEQLKDIDDEDIYEYTSSW